MLTTPSWMEQGKKGRIEGHTSTKGPAAPLSLYSSGMQGEKGVEGGKKNPDRKVPRRVSRSKKKKNA
jgi:hypothetical protein